MVTYKGYWSRRINQEHRFIYKVENNMIIVASCRFHY
ncbi:MAG: type II toxin-antitoxin system YoeB family toxin [Saprospiraceae bacterium]|nr:type II toxin-antitoxin system YoeB family toxin [Saprospiraceae bacterium]